MKKVYEAPELRTLSLEATDCISVSGGYEVGDTDPTVDIGDII